MKEMVLIGFFLFFQTVVASQVVQDDAQDYPNKKPRLSQDAQSPDTQSPGHGATPIVVGTPREIVTEDETSTPSVVARRPFAYKLSSLMEASSLQDENEKLIRKLMERVLDAHAQGRANILSGLCYELIEAIQAPVSINTVQDACNLLVEIDFREGGYNPLWCHIFAAQACLVCEHPIAPKLYFALGQEGYVGDIQGVHFNPVLSYINALDGFRKSRQLHHEVYQIDALLGLGKYGYIGQLGDCLYFCQSDVYKDAYALAYRRQDRERMFEALMGLGSTYFLGPVVDRTFYRTIDVYMRAYQVSLELGVARQISALLEIARLQCGPTGIPDEGLAPYLLHQKAVNLACENGLTDRYAQCLLNIGILKTASYDGTCVFWGRSYDSWQECFLHAYELARSCGVRPIQERAILSLVNGGATQANLCAVSMQTLDHMFDFIRMNLSDRWIVKYLLGWGEKLNYLTRENLDDFLHVEMFDRNTFIDAAVFESEEVYQEVDMYRDSVYMERTAAFMQRVAFEAAGQARPHGEVEAAPH
ncbi:MAG: hypothetical protein LCH26_07025 [Proteobacteria bacterium]|nr:hypothetical protein [Pseudomonadota bacterium]